MPRTVIGRIGPNGYESSPSTPEDEARLRDMLASRQPPTCQTDREFLEGSTNGKQYQVEPKYTRRAVDRRSAKVQQYMADKVANFYAAPLRAQGDSTTGKVYKHTLARFPGDPEAWVSSTSDVKRVCEERGWNCEGHVNVATTMDAAPTKARLSDHIVNQEANAIMADEPHRDRREVVEQVIEKHGSGPAYQD